VGGGVCGFWGWGWKAVLVSVNCATNFGESQMGLSKQTNSNQMRGEQKEYNS